MQNAKHLRASSTHTLEISVEAEKAFVSPLLYKTILWLTNTELYSQAADPANMAAYPKCLHITCDNINLATKVYSPKHLGLAVQIHHAYGSMGIVDILHSFGYCMSYEQLTLSHFSCCTCQQYANANNTGYLHPSRNLATSSWRQCCHRCGR